MLSESMSFVTANSIELAWVGAIVLLVGELAALMALPSLTRVVVISTIAEVGYLLIGIGIGGAAGDTGAWMHLGYQAVMRGLVVVVGWYLIRRTGSDRLDDLAGSGTRMPLAATLFGFGMFSVMGLSPFKGSFSKFLILYAAIEQGRWLLAIIGTIATIVAAVYYIYVIQRVCLERPPRSIELKPGVPGAMPLAFVLAAVTIYMSLWPHPFQHFAEGLAGVVNAHAVPEFETPWHELVLLPYIGGFVIYAIGRWLTPQVRDVAAVLLAIATVAVVTVGVLYPEQLPTFIPALKFDAAQGLFAILFSAIACLMIIYSTGYMARAEWANRYYFFAFLMVGSLIGLTTTHEFGNFYVFWELMTFTAYFLIVHEQTQKALRAGMVFFLMSAAGAYVMHFGILMVHKQVGSFEFAVLSEKIATIDPVVGFVIAACFLVGFAVKMGLVPLHSWAPLAYPEAPSSASGPLSGIVSKAGVFGAVKVLFLVFGVSTLTNNFTFHGVTLTQVVLVLGCITLLYGELRALFEPELKRMLAFSSLAQLGEIAAMLAIGTALATDAALLHVTNHAFMKTVLFYGAGAFILRTGFRRIEDLAGLGRRMPLTAGAYAIATAAIMGLPPFSGFISKFLMIYAAAKAGYLVVAALMLLGGLIGVVYYTRVVAHLFYFPYKGSEDVREAPFTMVVAITILAAAIVAGGLAPGYQLDLITGVGNLVALKGALAAGALPSLVIEWPLGATIAFLGAIVVLLSGRISHALSGWVCVVVMLASLAGVVYEYGAFGNDLMSFIFAVLIALMGAFNMTHATAYLAHSHTQSRFFAAFTVMIAGLLGMCQATNIFTFFAFWEVMSSWALWAALAHEETFTARREAFKYFIFNSVGASFMFLGFALVAVTAGTFELAGVGKALLALPPLTVAPGVILVLLGMVMKAAMLPVRIDYQMHPALAPTPVSGYISSTLLKAGPWGVLKFFVIFGGFALFNKLGGTYVDQPVVYYVISSIAAVTILYAGAMALLQNGMKLLLIYSTVCQLGYVLLGVSLVTPLGVTGGLMHFVNHMFLKDTLFLVAGAVMVAGHATMLDQLGGVGRRMPITFGIFLFAGLSLAGVPPLNGFSSKWVIFMACFESGHYLMGAAAMIGSLFTLAAVLKFAHTAFMGTPTPEAEHAHEAPMAMLVPMVLMTIFNIVLGFFPGLLMMPISTILTELGFQAVPNVTLTGLPGLEAWNPALMSVVVLLLSALLVPWLRLGQRVQTSIHKCGVEDIAPEGIRIGAVNLFDNPDAIIRRALFARKRSHEPSDIERL